MTPGLIELDLNGRSPRDVYRLLIGLVIPRPIAWVTTRDKQGRANAAPFSFFNVMAEDPPLVVLGLEARRNVDAHKDTTTNILENEAFIVHVVDRAHAEAMNCTAVDVPPEVDELAECGIPTLPGFKVDVPRIASAPALLECRLTSLASVVSLAELLYSAYMARSLIYNASPIVAAAAIYLAILWPFVRLVS
jgi:flavin reductase (DIM6/NTAB) family NADH-FMN oxidoreductase RutF